MRTNSFARMRDEEEEDADNVPLRNTHTLAAAKGPLHEDNLRTVPLDDEDLDAGLDDVAVQMDDEDHAKDGPSGGMRDGGSSFASQASLSQAASYVESNPRRSIIALVSVAVFMAVVMVVVLIAINAPARATGALPNPTPTPTPSIPPRLSRDVIPSLYTIELTPDLSTFTFTGQSSIMVQVTTQTSYIRLNAAELTITAADVVGRDPSSVQMLPDQELIQINFAQPLQPGEYQLDFAFTGTLNDRLLGFYRSSFDYQGTKHWIASTQFESSDARRAFPCFDEPDFKANFSIALVVDPSLTAISNMPELSRTTVGSKVRVQFQTSVRMSTYLVAFIIGPFDYVEKQSGNTRVRVYATRVSGQPTRAPELQFALDTAVGVLQVFNSYLDFDYALPKADLVAIPDFAAGAMENWGCITFRETGLLVDNSSSLSTKQYVAAVVAHELAHQWFGNLVTMRWWSDLWLNEGFATYFEYLGVDGVYPEWDYWGHFVESDMNRALSLDAKSSSHPLSVAHLEPTAIEEMFDSISYSKGGTLLRMIRSYLDQQNGANTFRNAIRDYLKRYAYGNADSRDLLNSLQTSTGLPTLAEDLSSWTTRAGYPVITLAANGNNGAFTATQSRFFYAKADADAYTGPNTWWVPFTYKLADGSTSLEPFKDATATSTKAFTTNMVANVNRTGLYRVNYPAATWSALRVLVAQQSLLSERDRAGLINDAFNLLHAELLGVVHAAALLPAVANDTSYAVMRTAVSASSSLQLLMSDTSCFARFQAMVRSMVGPSVTRLGWTPVTNEHADDTLMRALVLSTASSYNNNAVVTEARNRYDAFVANETGNNIPGDQRDLVYRSVVQHGGQTYFDSMKNRYETQTFPEEKRRCLYALTQASQTSILTSLLDYAINASNVRTQDTVRVISMVAANPAGTEAAWTFFKAQWPELNRRYGGGGFAIDTLVTSVTSHFATQSKLDEVEAWFRANPVPTAQRSVSLASENIKANMRWLSVNATPMCTWLQNEGF